MCDSNLGRFSTASGSAIREVPLNKTALGLDSARSGKVFAAFSSVGDFSQIMDISGASVYVGRCFI